MSYDDKSTITSNVINCLEKENHVTKTEHKSSVFYERCAVCNKKLKTCSLQCKCKKLFCAAHISNINHKCSFDFKKHHQDILRAHNPVIHSLKL